MCALMAPPRKKRARTKAPRGEQPEEEVREEPAQDEEPDAEPDAEPDDAEAAAHEEPDDEEGPLDRYLPFVTRVAPPAVIVAAISAGWVFGPATAILVLTGGVLVGVIAFFWGSLRALVGEAPLTGADAFVLAVPTAEEEKKRALLRTLKDIEYEHSVGKLSDADFHELATRYREQAKALMRTIHEASQPRRDRAEVWLRRRRGEVVAEPAAEPPEAPKAPVACAECDTENDPDARFCKSCGTSLGGGDA